MVHIDAGDDWPYRKDVAFVDSKVTLEASSLRRNHGCK